MKNIVRQKSFSGCNFDVDYTDIKPTDSPLLADVCLTPIGALTSINGSVKDNTTALSGQVMGFCNYKARNKTWVVAGISDGTIQDT